MCKGPGHGEGTFSRTQSSVWPGMAGGKAGVVGQSQIVGKLRQGLHCEDLGGPGGFKQRREGEAQVCI